jgi:hypothetical protein
MCHVRCQCTQCEWICAAAQRATPHSPTSLLLVSIAETKRAASKQRITTLCFSVYIIFIQQL